MLMVIPKNQSALLVQCYPEVIFGSHGEYVSVEF